MHDIAVIRVAAGYIWENFAKGVWVQTLIEVPDGVMDFLFGGGCPPLEIFSDPNAMISAKMQ
jgi:hypothetical protein